VIALKAFFCDVDILHLCGPVAWHLFRSRHQYKVTWEDVWWNRALVARVCFDDRTWFQHWWPNVFREHINARDEEALSSPLVLSEHEEFLAQKRRPDHEFWRGVLFTDEPPEIRA
jgi:hypothetical protein